MERESNYDNDGLDPSDQERGKCTDFDKRLDTITISNEIVVLIVSIIDYAAEQELQQIKSRIAEGRAVALSRGVRFGRKRKYDSFQVIEVMKKKSQREGLGTIARSIGMSRSMVQRILRQEVVA